MAGMPADFSEMLRLLRGMAGWTQEDLAARAAKDPASGVGLGVTTISELERRKHPTCQKETAERLADAFGLADPARDMFIAVARGQLPASAVIADGTWDTLCAHASHRGQPPASEAGWRLAVAGSPYRGLSSFAEQDAEFFFGREAATAQVLERMARLAAGGGMLVVSGVSGAGKSSLLQAGVLPALRAGGLAAVPGSAAWPSLLLTPGAAPLDELALRAAAVTGADAAAVRRELDADPAGFALTARQAALRAGERPGAGPAAGQPLPLPLVLIADQFEQVFTLCPDERHRRAFITALHAAAVSRAGQAGAALVVVVVRADFEARCADYPQLAGAVQDRYLVTAMTRRQLQMAITEPAKKAGARVDPDLVQALLDQAGAGPDRVARAGVLPLVSHALDQTWRSRSAAAAVLTLADYERTGGIEAALAASAQRAYDRLSPPQQALARQVFTRLTATTDDGADTASPVTRAELTASSPGHARDMDEVLDAFAAERLLTLDAGTVEITHEILLTAWPLLREVWLAETRADRVTRTRLRNTTAEWQRHSRDPSYLYDGTLQAATETTARVSADPARHPPLTPAEHEFLTASHRARQRRARQRQAVLAGLLALVLGLAATTVLAVRASRQAARQLAATTAGELDGESQLLADANPGLSRLLSIAAWRLHPAAATRYAMLAAAGRPEIAVFPGRSGRVYSLVFSPDGTTLAAATGNGEVRLWDAVSHQPLAGHCATFSDQPPLVCRAAGRRPFGVPFPGYQHRPYPFLDPGGLYPDLVTFSPDGKTMAAPGPYPREAALWDVATGRQMTRPLFGNGYMVTSAASAPPGCGIPSPGRTSPPSETP